MEKRRLGSTDLDLSLIGLGTWAIGGASWAYGWGPQDDSESISCIHEAIAAGVNWIDTAAVYGLGHSEAIIGEALKSVSKDIIIATKCGLLADKAGEIYGKIKRASILSEIEGSLRRLGVDCIDIYQIHWPSPSEDIEEAFETLLYLKKQGKIRYAAVSNFSREQLNRVAALEGVTSLQAPYSLLNRRVEIDILPWCIEHNCGFLAYSPLECGILTGKVTRGWAANLPDDDWRKRHSQYFSEPGLSRVLSFIERIKESLPRDITDKPNWLMHIAIKWLTMRDGVTSVIVGARKPGQITDVIAALCLPVSEGDIAVISKLTPPPLT